MNAFSLSRLKLKGNGRIWIVVALLCMISLLAVYSSSSSLAYISGKSNLSFFFKQLSFVIMGMVSLAICYMIPMKWYRLMSIPLFATSCFLLLLTILVGKTINGAERWLSIGFINFQPSELAKISLVLYLARVIEYKKLDTFKEYALNVLLPVGTMIALAMMGSVSVMMVMSIITFVILVIAGVKWSHLFKTILIGIGMLAFAVVLNKIFDIDALKRLDTAESRITVMFSKDKDKEEMTPEERQRMEDKTFQADMAALAIANGGIFGKGPGNSEQKNLLPHPYSDFIFAIIVEEYGYLSFIVMGLYIWLYVNCVLIARKCSKKFSAITVIGLGFLISTQAFLHILVNVGFLPVTGQTLPLVSLGGSAYLILSGAFGIILSVSRTTEMQNCRQVAEDYMSTGIEISEREQTDGRSGTEQEITEN